MNPQTPPSPTARLLLDAAAIERALKRIAHEIIERNPDLSRLAIVGVPSRGVVVAQRLAGFVQQFGDAGVETGVVDIGVTDHVSCQSGERGGGFDCVADLFPDSVFADAEQNMYPVIGRMSLRLREEVLEDIIGGFAENRVRRDQDRHAAEAIGPHLRTGERRDRGDVAERG